MSKNLHQTIIMSLSYCVRICQWIWTVHLWGMADMVDGHTQAPGKKWDVPSQTTFWSRHCDLFSAIICFVSRRQAARCLFLMNNIMSFIFPPGLQSGRGRGLIPAHGDPGTGAPARAPGTAVTILHALARRSAGRERRSESDGRKAFHLPRAKH